MKKLMAAILAATITFAVYADCLDCNERSDEGSMTCPGCLETEYSSNWYSIDRPDSPWKGVGGTNITVVKTVTTATCNGPSGVGGINSGNTWVSSSCINPVVLKTTNSVFGNCNQFACP